MICSTDTTWSYTPNKRFYEINFARIYSTNLHLSYNISGLIYFFYDDFLYFYARFKIVLNYIGCRLLTWQRYFSCPIAFCLFLLCLSENFGYYKFCYYGSLECTDIYFCHHSEKHGWKKCNIILNNETYNIW